MAFTTTWTFNNTYEGFTFTEVLVDGVGSATRSHVSGAIRNTIVIPAGAPDKTVYGQNTSPDYSGIMHDAEAGDQLELDFSATDDGKIMRTQLYAIYDDTTSNNTFLDQVAAGSLTLPLTVGKRLKHIEFWNWQKSSLGQDHYRDVTEIRLITQSAIGNISGILRTPSNYIEDQGGGASGGAGGGAGGNIADISADGLYIYLALFDNSGFPVLVRIAATLAADGNILFSPNAGGRIGVQTARFNADHVWVAGEFDGTNTVEKSEDAGSSFTVKDNGVFGAIRTFNVGPDSDNRIMLFDGDNGDIIESIDGGETWTTINASVTPLVNSIARYGVNIEELIAGNQGAANDSIDYSPNSGVDLEDYQTGVYPNADCTKVITN